MKGSDSAQSSNANRQSDSEDENWEENKLIIDLDVNMSVEKTLNNSSVKEEIKDGTSTDHVDADQLDSSSSNTNMKMKMKRGTQKNNKTDKVQSGAKNAKNAKQEKTTSTKGRKKKEKKSGKDSPTAAADVKSDPYEFEPQDDSISASVTGLHPKDRVKSEAVGMKDAATDYDYRSTATVTDSECLGPCEPGTHVCLEGIVWQETENGVLVVNVTWKGKTYMGTLLDATKHDWAPIRNSCDSPTSDFDGRTPKARGKRRVPLSDTFKDINERKLRKEIRKANQQAAVTNQPLPSPVKSENGKRRGRNSEGDNVEPTPKRGRNASRASQPPNSPPLIECPEPNCSKKYKHINGLRYHQNHAHQESTQIEDISDSDSKPISPEPPKRGRKKYSEDKKQEQINPKVEHRDLENMDINTDSSVSTSEQTDSIGTGANQGAIDKEQMLIPQVTSVITATPVSHTQIVASQAVPVAAIPPQVVKPLFGEDKDKNRSKPGSSPVISAPKNLPPGPHKLLPKTATSAATPMAPISTMSQHTVLNSSLKAIQPKPTVLGESTPNPGLHELRDQKKIKRKRSVSKEEWNGSVFTQSDLQKLGQSIQRIDNDKTTTSQIREPDSANNNGNVLQSPSYSDISDEGFDNKGLRKDYFKSGPGSISQPMTGAPGMFNQSPYLVATVSPQKPPFEKERKVESQTAKTTQPSRLSPAPKPSTSEVSAKQKEFELQKKQQQQYLSNFAMLPPYMNSEMYHHMMVSKERSRSVSPRPHSIRGPSPKPNDYKASNERLQLLKENMEVKSQMSPAATLHDAPKDYSMPTSRQPDDVNKLFMYPNQQKMRDHEERKPRESHGNLFQSTSSHNREEKHQRASSTSTSMSSAMNNPYVAHPFLSLPAMPSPNHMSQLLARTFPTMMHPGYNPYAAYPQMMDMKDFKNSGATPFNSRSHKIHELEEMARAAKSPNTSIVDKDKQHSGPTSKSQPMYPPAMLAAYNVAALQNQQMPFLPPK